MVLALPGGLPDIDLVGPAGTLTGGKGFGVKALKMLLSSFLIGALSLGLAWAGAVIAPPTDADGVSGATKVKRERNWLQEEVPVVEAVEASESGEFVLQPGQVLAGAAKISMEPRPEEYGGVWEKSMDECRAVDTGDFEAMRPPSANTDHIASTGSPWNENPNCLYMGGFDIGPVNPIIDWDQEFGLWVRSFAVKGPNGKTLTMTIIDGEGYLWDYKSKCTDCGIKQITAELASDPELGLEKEGIIIAATHSHAAPEFLGGWGFVPDWYMKQISDSIKDSIRQAVTTMEPAVLETGEEAARPFNGERRGTYRSAEEQNLTWLRAIAIDDDHGQGNENGHGNDPAEDAPRTIATIGAYAAHPTKYGTNGGTAHADWPALFEKRLEERFGGVGLYFMTGLGNMTSNGRDIGAGLAALIPEVGGGLRLDSTDVKYAQTTWGHPATNVPLTGLGMPGFFDRKFLTTPAEVRTGKNPTTAPCESASPASVEMPATAARIGNLFALSAAPGEIFANVSNTIKENSGAVVTMPIGQANDALGYMPQSFELHPVGQQGLGFAAGGFVFVNYEDSYAVDRCLGDKVLEETIRLFGTI